MTRLVKWSPFFDENDDFDGLFPVLRDDKQEYLPAIDMYENKHSVIVEAQLAGVDLEKVSISIQNDVLVIKGESEKKSEVEDKNYYRKEIKRGGFFRSLQLPSHVDGDKAEAEADAGVLKIVIPKVLEGKTNSIKIKKKINKK